MLSWLTPIVLEDALLSPLIVGRADGILFLQASDVGPAAAAEGGFQENEEGRDLAFISFLGWRGLTWAHYSSLELFTENLKERYITFWNATY